jgi:uncharacterized membrane protein
MQEYKTYTRLASALCLGLGTLFTFFALATLTSLLMLFVFQVREPSPDISPIGLLLSMTVSGLIGGLGIGSFLFRKSNRGWRLATIFGGLLSAFILFLPFLLLGERGGPPVGAISVVVLSLVGLWILMVSRDSVIRAVREGSRLSAGTEES